MSLGRDKTTLTLLESEEVILASWAGKNPRKQGCLCFVLFPVYHFSPALCKGEKLYKVSLSACGVLVLLKQAALPRFVNYLSLSAVQHE